jgi:hypothetical protein
LSVIDLFGGMKMNCIDGKHLAFDDFERYIKTDLESINQDEITFFDEFDDRLDNCEVCTKRFEAYTFISSMIDTESPEDTLYRTITLKYPKPMQAPNAAASTDDGFMVFLSEPITQNDISGTLYFMGNEYSQVYLEFVFDKCQKTIPCEFEFNFTTTNDHNEHIITISSDNPVGDPETGIKAIRSDLANNINYSGGLEANYTINLKIFNYS